MANTGKANRKIVVDRLEWVDRMVEDIRSLPLGSLDVFLKDRRNVAAAESCLRRALEALLDLGRHLLSKVCSTPVTEYKKIAEELASKGLLAPEAAQRLRILAGYRNRLVHFYHQVSPEELYEICTLQLEDLLLARRAFAEWLQKHPESMDDRL